MIDGIILVEATPPPPMVNDAPMHYSPDGYIITRSPSVETTLVDSDDLGELQYPPDSPAPDVLDVCTPVLLVAYHQVQHQSLFIHVN